MHKTFLSISSFCISLQTSLNYNDLLEREKNEYINAKRDACKLENLPSPTPQRYRFNKLFFWVWTWPMLCFAKPSWTQFLLIEFPSPNKSSSAGNMICDTKTIHNLDKYLYKLHLSISQGNNKHGCLFLKYLPFRQQLKENRGSK